MHVQIALETPYQAFTNLDFVKGKILLRLPSTIPLTSIVVKLEGESTSQLTPPPRDDYDDKPRPVLEIHKILYNVQTVFPRAEQASPSERYYTLPAGNYEYPFSFKIPFNSSCDNTLQRLQTLPNLVQKGTISSSGHIKAPLPPTLGGFPGLASIRYYVKCTVKRKEFYKENPRIVQQINFIPLEQIRPPKTDSENFGRRTYQFTLLKDANGGVVQPKMKRVLSNLSLSKKTSSASESANTEEQIPPKVEVDARLPDPAILTSNQPLPLRLIVKRLDDGSLPLYLQTLQVELVGHTKIRAGQIVRNESSSWVVSSRSNLNQYLAFPEPDRQIQLKDAGDANKDTPASAADRKSSEASIPGSPCVEKPGSMDEKARLKSRLPHNVRQIVLDATPWEYPIPQTVAPNFKTCNLERTYDLEARIGIGYGAHSAKTQIILPLRLACQVWSGIPPPKALIAAMESRPNAPSKKPVSKKPLSAEAAANVANHQAQAQADAQFGPLPPGEEEPPPSYEDAMATNIEPVDGPRNYQPPPAPAGGDGFARDRHEKRRDS